MLVVEIGQDWVKIVQAEPSRRGLTVSRLYLETFKEAGPEISRSIAAALKQQRFSRVPAIGCLPRQMVNIRILELPSTDAEEIADMVDLQAAKQTPYTKDEIVADYRILGASRQGYARVMLAIIQRTVLRERYYLLEEAGLDVGSMSVSTEGVLNWYLHAAARAGWGNDSVALVDVDSFYTDFIVIVEGQLVFTRSIMIGANHLVEDYASWRDKFAREVRRSIEMFQAETPSSGPARLVVSGAGARFERLATELSAELKLPAEAVDCRDDVRSLPASPPLAEAPFRTVSLTPLVGMALDPDKLEFRLMPDSVRARKELVEKARGLSLFAMLLMAVLVSISTVVTANLLLKRNYRDALRRHFQETRPGVERVERMRATFGVIKRRQNASAAAIVLLSDIHKQTPAALFLDAIEIDTQTKRVVLGGTTEDRKSIRALVGNLEQSPLFADVQQIGDKPERGNRIRFQVACTMEEKP